MGRKKVSWNVYIYAECDTYGLFINELKMHEVYFFVDNNVWFHTARAVL